MIRQTLGSLALLNLLLLLFLALPAWAQAARPGVPETFPQAPILEPGRLAPALFSLGRPEEKAPGTRRGLPPDPGPPSAQRPQSHGAARIIWLRFVVYREGVVSRGMTIGVLRRHRYDAYGVVLSEETYTPAAGALTDTQITSGLKYKGQTFDAETGQVYLRNRYYEPETGQFTQVDPARAGDNWFAYTTDPINRYDPSGLDWVWVGAGNGQYGPDKGWRWVPNAEGGTSSAQLEEYDYNLVEGIDPPEWAVPRWAGRREGQVVRTANAVGRNFQTFNQNDRRFANIMAEGASLGRVAPAFGSFDAGWSLYRLWQDLLRDDESVSTFRGANRAVQEIFAAKQREIERLRRENRPEFEFRSEQLGPATKVFAKEVGALALDAFFLNGDALRDHSGSGLSQNQIEDYRLAVGILSLSSPAGWNAQARRQGRRAFRRGEGGRPPGKGPGGDGGGDRVLTDEVLAGQNEHRFILNPRNHSPREQATVDFLQERGLHVSRNRLEGAVQEFVPLSNQGGRQGDIFLNGVLTEIKSLDSGAVSGTIKNVLNESRRGGGQARQIIIDARGTGLTQGVAQSGINRSLGVDKIKESFDNIILIGDDFLLGDLP